ncbi:MAG: hypothetical protein JNK56_05330 [Myxococcales bacterium]|nr:hypothetical protein [Myxococcales bacterium]
MRGALILSAVVGCSAPASETEGTSTSSGGGESTSTGTTAVAPTTGGSSGASEGTTGAAPAWEVALQLGDDRGALLSVWGPAPDDVYAVGGQQSSPIDSTGVLYHFDGAAWTEQALPEGTPMLHWVFGVEGDLWAVGRNGATLRREGEAWVAKPSGVTTILWGIWGPSKDLLWTVGGDGVDDAPVLLRWDGAAWAPEMLPATGESTGLFKLWGTGASDVTAVGDRGLALHHDGAAWTVQPTGDLADLISVWGRAPDEQLAVGGRANGRLARWDGAAWTGETFGVPGLSGVWMDADGAATVVGMQGTIAELAPGSMVLQPQTSPTLLLLHAVFGFADGTRFAVGGSLAGPPPYVGVIVQRLP